MLFGHLITYADRFYSRSQFTHAITIPLLPGTHHLRFLVDEQWRVADDLPTAVDDQGSLANYVGVALDGIVVGGVAETSSTPTSPGIEQGPQVEITLAPSVRSLSPVHMYKPRISAPAQSFWSASSADDDDGSYRGPAARASATVNAVLGKKVPAKWTTDIPIELTEAAEQEDSFLQATDAQTQNVQARPNPHSPTPYRERGRDRGHNGLARGGGQTQIINGFTPPPPIPPAPNLPRHLEKLILNVSSYPRGGSTNGTVIGATGGMRSPPLPGKEREGRDDKGRRTGKKDRRSLPGLQSSTVPAPLQPFEADALPPPSAQAGSSSSSPPPSAGPTSASSSAAQSPTLSVSDSVSLPSSNLDTSILPPSLTALNATSPTKIDDTVSADDGSVLPVPSHVILHHLSTSAIKNGVLAVGVTTRYKKKVGFVVFPDRLWLTVFI